jgi:hypothetical protein
VHTNMTGGPSDRPRLAFDPAAADALRGLVLNGYRVLNPEGHDVTDVILRVTEPGR